MVYVPVAEPPRSAASSPFVVPAVELAVTVHHGPHDDIDVSYGALGTYVAEHALAVAGPVRENYLVGPRDTGDAARLAHGDRLARLPYVRRLRTGPAAGLTGDHARRRSR